ncbi:hypothetical protein [uncultured Jatrophihabitans sp.]
MDLAVTGGTWNPAVAVPVGIFIAVGVVIVAVTIIRKIRGR